VLVFSLDAGDPTEGFGLETVGQFDTVSWGPSIDAFIAPEPASGLMVGVGVAGLGYSRQRRWL
jgi:hypothetical protein